MERLDCAVIGAGVVGLAVARALAMAGREVIILERADAFGTETSARNSEVIHAGIYYPPDSLKAKLCLRGKHLLYDYCASHGVTAKRCGKLIVAADGQEEALEAIRQNALTSGVDDLVALTRSEALDLEPEVACSSALLSPSTGIVDSHSLMLAYLGDAEEAGAMLALNAPLDSGRVTEDGIILEIGGPDAMTLIANTVVNSAGLWAQATAKSIDGIPADTIPECHYARGVYFTLTGRQPFTRPVYPIPEPGGLGCHYTLDLGGQGKFGPDVEWLDEVDYTVNEARAPLFYEAVRRYWPALPDNALQPGYAGIRPKLFGQGGPATDFVIQGPAEHGVSGLINLYGIESPGLTSSLAIAEIVSDLAA